MNKAGWTPKPAARVGITGGNRGMGSTRLSSNRPLPAQISLLRRQLWTPINETVMDTHNLTLPEKDPGHKLNSERPVLRHPTRDMEILPVPSPPRSDRFLPLSLPRQLPLGGWATQPSASPKPDSGRPVEGLAPGSPSGPGQGFFRES